MTSIRKTVIVTGASQGIGAGVANLFLERGYNVVANSRHISEKNELQRSDNLAVVDGDIALPLTAVFSSTNSHGTSSRRSPATCDVMSRTTLKCN